MTQISKDEMSYFPVAGEKQHRMGPAVSHTSTLNISRSSSKQ
jgi:hypothetical protein